MRFVLILICWMQAKEDRALVKRARLHAGSAHAAAIQAGSDETLTAQFKEVDAKVSAAEAWAKACDDGEAAVKRAREALAAGNRDEAAGHCRQARGLLDGGLKCESLGREVKELELALHAGMALRLQPAFLSSPSDLVFQHAVVECAAVPL